MTFRLYDSATQAVRDLKTVVPGQVSIYHCGLTVQSAPHLGHIRKEVVFDVLRRWLEQLGYAVTVIANITDIEDKILAKSAAAGVPWWAHAYRYERELHAAYAALGCLPPTYEPRATGHIPEIIELIQTLLDRGHAYTAEDGSGDVYFDVRSWPDYGSLSHQSIEDMESDADAGSRGKRDPRDFALWKTHKPAEPITASWRAPWGRGRPGWHIECSAMAGKYLGDEFDIHGAGIDLRFPHNENELAQSTAAGRPFARYWMHNGLVSTAGEKMSKSLGTGALVSKVTKDHPSRAVRFYLLAPHYRSTVEFSDTSLTEATASLDRIDHFVGRARARLDAVTPRLPDSFTSAMNDDLGTPDALAVLYEAVRDGNTALEGGDRERAAERLADVTGMLAVLGLAADDPVWQSHRRDEPETQDLVDGLIGELLRQREAARARKDYQAADNIRDNLVTLGVEVSDTPDGPNWRVGRH